MAGGADAADFRVILIRVISELGEIERGGAVAARQAGRLDIGRVVHLEGTRHPVHGSDKAVQATRVGPSQCMRRAVVGGDQRQMQQLAACVLAANGQTRSGALKGVAVCVRNGDFLIHRQACIHHQHRRHQLGNRGDRRLLGSIFRQQGLPARLIEYQDRLRTQRRHRHVFAGGRPPVVRPVTLIAPLHEGLAAVCGNTRVHAQQNQSGQNSFHMHSLL